MKRRDFLKRFGIGAGIAIAAPTIAKALVEKPRQTYAVDLETEDITPLVNPGMWTQMDGPPWQKHNHLQYPLTHKEAYPAEKRMICTSLDMRPHYKLGERRSDDRGWAKNCLIYKEQEELMFDPSIIGKPIEQAHKEQAMRIIQGMTWGNFNKLFRVVEAFPY